MEGKRHFVNISALQQIEIKGPFSPLCSLIFHQNGLNVQQGEMYMIYARAGMMCSGLLVPLLLIHQVLGDIRYRWLRRQELEALSPFLSEHVKEPFDFCFS